MKVAVVTVQSIDGKLMHGDNPQVHDWSSDEDAAHFVKMRDDADAIIMGGTTYELMRNTLEPKPSRVRIVVTRHPEKYDMESMPGTLEFTDADPHVIIEHLKKEGRQNVLVAGGGQINALFMQAGVVTDLYTTVEPRLFGDGVELLSNQRMDIRLELLETRQLNEQGTLLLHYKVLEIA